MALALRVPVGGVSVDRGRRLGRLRRCTHLPGEVTDAAGRS